MSLLGKNHEAMECTNRLIFDCMEYICHEMIQNPETFRDREPELTVRIVPSIFDASNIC